VLERNALRSSENSWANSYLAFLLRDSTTLEKGSLSPTGEFLGTWIVDMYLILS
jgi:hypothetical protein